jgi:GNAT superfamily N-acetyltransferase
MNLVRALQERAARALPAERVENLGGWWLRRAAGCSWWVDTVLPHGDTVDLVRGIARAERFYADHGVAARFQITPGACPDGLDAALAERGYRRGSPMSLRVAPTARVLGQGRAEVRVDEWPSHSWFRVWHAVHGGDARAEWDLLARVRQPSAYASAVLGGEVVAVGRAVVDTGWVGVFGMATLPAVRGKGAARAVLGALADWAKAPADRMYLQVERDNAAALRLYERAGFSELREYHYRG